MNVVKCMSSAGGLKFHVSDSVFSSRQQSQGEFCRQLQVRILCNVIHQHHGNDQLHNFHLQLYTIVVICIHSAFQSLDTQNLHFQITTKETRVAAKTLKCRLAHDIIKRSNNRNCVTRWKTPIDSFWASPRKQVKHSLQILHPRRALVTHAAKMRAPQNSLARSFCIFNHPQTNERRSRVVSRCFCVSADNFSFTFYRSRFSSSSRSTRFFLLAISLLLSRRLFLHTFLFYFIVF